MGKTYGDIFAMAFGPIVTVFVSHPEALQQLFTNTKEIEAPGELNRAAAPLIGNNGLLLLDGVRHKHRRKLLMPAFHGDRIRGYGDQICTLTEAIMSRQPIGQPFSAYAMLQAMTLQVILEVIFGFHAGEPRYAQLKQLLPTLMNFARSPGVEIAFSLPALQQSWWSPWQQFHQLMEQFNQLIYAEIDHRRQHPDPTRTDILSELVVARDELGEPMDNQSIRDLFPSMLFAGRDAASSAIAWALYWIHRLPNVRDQVLQELDRLGNSADPLSIVQLPYLTAVCNESLRIYPTQIVTFPRRVESSIKLMGYELAPGTVIRGNIYLTHRRADLYPEPLQFKPERFLERQFSSYEFLPFGGGVRRCPGEVLALFEMKLVLATVLLRYHLELTDTATLRPQRRGVNFSPKGGLMMVSKNHRMGMRS
ncbi:MAG: cytochrome P450 [Leptolyngbyaceae cyanobacterium CRU_2_3]|nr:cytochrome P450 [Leptolyngbyaceae cyanobacterium CRU_2_3]